MKQAGQALNRFAPILVGAAVGVLGLLLVLPFLSRPLPGLAEIMLIGLGAVALIGLAWSAGHGLRLAARTRAEADALRRRVEDVEIFAVAARHDMREPLRKIITFGERLNDGLGAVASDPQLARYAERMSDAAERMRGMLDELTIWSRVNDDNTRPDVFAAQMVIADVVTAAADALAACGGRVDIGSLPDVRADRVQFGILFEILLANAIQYAAPDRPLVVSIEGEQTADGGARIRVADNGIGFADNQAERIFLPFERLHGRDAYPGTGIGLATARKIAQRQGGQLVARGDLGIGAVFTLILPRQKASL
ncbi:ATP-binding protein [Maricaulis sp.]|uniref:sensor histidine kinase n=1 Tax=Maricaulis sp. TaxID=1486257 RepID=UPI0025BCEBB2|nr:ATP-binding protein [Maricaulis sp.]